MGAPFGLVALVVALLGVLATLGNAGYLALLSSTAGRRGVPGVPITDYVRSQRAMAAGLIVMALLGLLCTTGGPVADTFGLVLGGASTVAGYRAWSAARRRFRDT